MSERRNPVDIINRILADHGIFAPRRKHSYLIWREQGRDPKDQKATDQKRARYLFAYTPHKTRDDDTGKIGFLALKIRVLKSGKRKIVKKVRFGRRKIARARSLKWYDEYYGREA